MLIVVVGVGNVLALFVLGIAAATVAESAATPERRPEPVANAPDGDDQAALDVVRRLLADKAMYRDSGLSLDRLARKSGMPARRISAVVNRHAGKNVSQYVDDFRVAEACRLLRETDKPVTEILFEAGFQTKSNFNREFRRVTGTNPLAWRERHTTL